MKKILWTIDKLRTGFEKYFQTYGRYPTVQEIDAYPHLPTSKTLQRRFGGAKGLRTTLGLPITDFTQGETRSKAVKRLLIRANESEQQVFLLLKEAFGEQFVHREYLFTDDHRFRADFFVFSPDGNFCVDVFYPDNPRNMIGCLNNKLKTYAETAVGKYPVIFLQMNPDIEDEQIDRFIAAKKNKLLDHQAVMSYEAFKRYCRDKRRHAIR